MKNQLLLSILLMSTLCVAQQKKPTTPQSKPLTKPYVAPKKTATATAPAPAPRVKPQPVVQQETQTRPAPAATQAKYDKYQDTRTVTEAPKRRYDYGSVVKFNFMGLILGGVNLDFEKRIATRNSIILAGGYYPFGLLKGSYRLGLDLRQYLGQSYTPKGLFVSAGALYHFIPYDKTSINGNTTSTSTSSAGLLNLRGFVGYQFVTGHFTFEVAGGPAYSFILTDTQKLSDKQSSIAVGFLPAFKLSLGYAF